MSTVKSFFCFVAVAISLLYSCGKKNSGPPTGQPPPPKKSACQIVTITDTIIGTGTFVYNLTYDDSNRLATEKTSGPANSISKTFTYSGDSVEVIVTNTFGGPYTDSISLRPDGLMTSDLFIGPGSKLLTTYTYSDSGEVQSNSRYFDGTFLGTGNYYWTGGNMYRDSFNAYTYVDQPSMTGDYWYFTQIFNTAEYYTTNSGAMVVKPRNLVVAISGQTINGLVTDNITYRYDSTGKITWMGIGQDSLVPRRIAYQYQCK